MADGKYQKQDCRLDRLNSLDGNCRVEATESNKCGDSKQSSHLMLAGWLIFTFTFASVLLSGPDRPGDRRRQSNFFTDCQPVSTSWFFCFNFKSKTHTQTNLTDRKLNFHHFLLSVMSIHRAILVFTPLSVLASSQGHVNAALACKITCCSVHNWPLFYLYSPLQQSSSVNSSLIDSEGSMSIAWLNILAWLGWVSVRSVWLVEPWTTVSLELIGYADQTSSQLDQPKHHFYPPLAGKQGLISVPPGFCAVSSKFNHRWRPTNTNQRPASASSAGVPSNFAPFTCNSSCATS